MPTSVAKLRPAPVDVSPAKRGTLTVTSILEDKKWRRYFGALAQHYSQLLSQISSDLRLIAELNNPLYLIDADVIRNLSEIRYTDTRLRRESATLFENPAFQYAIPLGAFQELVEWVRGFAPGLIPWKEYSVDRNLSPEDTVRELAQAFDVPGDDADLDRVVDRLLTVLGTRGAVLERIIELFSRRNFRGVVADYDLAEVSELHQILGIVERPSESLISRAKRDFRDAINLSLVCKASRRRNSAIHDDSLDGSTSYVLVTQTRALLDLLEIVKEKDYDSFQALSTLLGFDAPALPNLYPVLTPRRAFLVEEVRARDMADQSSSEKLVEVRRAFEDLEGLLRGSGSSRDRSGTSRVESLQEHLEYLVGVYYEEDLYRKLEKDRVIEASLQRWEHRYRLEWEPGQRRAAQLREGVESFLRVARRLEVITTNMAPTSYHVDRHLDETGAFELVQLSSKRPYEIIMEGELYPAEDQRHDSFYSLSWHTSCTDKQFFSALSGIIALRRGTRTSERELRVERLAPFTMCDEGITVYTNVGPFAVRFDKLPSGHSLKQMAVSDLQIAIFDCVPELAQADIRIEAVRVSTIFGDFELSLTGDDPRGNEILVVSHCAINEQITHLCEATSLFAVFPIRLNDAVRSIVAKYPAFSQLHSHTA